MLTKERLKESESLVTNPQSHLQSRRWLFFPDRNPYAERISEIMGGNVLKLRSEELLEIGEARGDARRLVDNIETLVQTLVKPIEEV